MAAVCVEVADAVVAMIRNRQFNLDFVLERSYAEWDLELKELDNLELQESDKLRVDVVAHTTDQEVNLQTRSKVGMIVPVDIAIRRKFGPDKQDPDTGRVLLAEVDALMEFTQKLYLMFMPTRLTSFPDATWDEENGGTTIEVAPMRQHLRELHQFTGIIRVVFKASLEIG